MRVAPIVPIAPIFARRIAMSRPLPPVDVSIVIPAFNEEGRLGPTLERQRDARAEAACEAGDELERLRAQDVAMLGGDGGGGEARRSGGGYRREGRRRDGDPGLVRHVKMFSAAAS